MTRKVGHIGPAFHSRADRHSGLVHTVCFTSGHVGDIAEANTLLRGRATVAFGDAGYRDVHARPSLIQPTRPNRLPDAPITKYSAAAQHEP
jgi:IS5 family transposase